MHNRFSYQQVIHTLRSLQTTITEGYSLTRRSALTKKPKQTTRVAHPKPVLHQSIERRINGTVQSVSVIRSAQNRAEPCSGTPTKFPIILSHLLAIYCFQHFSFFFPPYRWKAELVGCTVPGFAKGVSKGVHFCVALCQNAGNASQTRAHQICANNTTTRHTNHTSN